MSTTEFDQLEAELASGGVEGVLDRLADRLRDKKQYHELFEALKMRIRQQIGLPLLYGEAGDDLSEPQRDKLEEGLLDACREVGTLLLKDGRIREGWMYMRPVGDNGVVAGALAEVEVDEDNLEEIVEVALHEGVDAERGFSLVLEHYGTCNAITTFESVMPNRSRADQQAAARLLAVHLHDELLQSVKADIAQQEGSEPAAATLRELVADREWLFGDHSYHVDTTHLAAVVRFARILDNEQPLRLALDLTEYGRRLSSQFQYQGDEPFADMYPSHALYLQALLGERVDEAIAYFRERAESLNVDEHGTIAIEVYIDLLARLGRYREAIETSIRKMPAGARSLGYAPPLLDLSEKAGSYEDLMKFCRERGDLLGFATGLVQAGSRK